MSEDDSLLGCCAVKSRRGDRHFRGAYRLHHQENSPETSVIFYETTRFNIPGNCHLQIRRRENLKSH
jgi:hypothetical protein